MLPFLRNKQRVLVLDDDVAMQKLVALLLGRAGYRVDVVTKGNQAIEAIERKAYDAILLDLMMPHEGGMTVIRSLREKHPQFLKRVILVTGAPEAVLRGLRGEIFAVVLKPFEAAELVNTLKRLTGR